MSDTPRTDKCTHECRHYFDIGGHTLADRVKSADGECVPADFARQLERELAAMTKERDEYKEWLKCYLPELEQIAKPHDIVRLKLDCKL